MTDVAKQSVLLIHSCCSKGWGQAVHLVSALNNNKLVYNLNVANTKQASKILEKYGISADTVKKQPQIYITDELMFPAEKVNDPDFVSNLIKSLKTIKETEDAKARQQ